MAPRVVVHGPQLGIGGSVTQLSAGQGVDHGIERVDHHQIRLAFVSQLLGIAQPIGSSPRDVSNIDNFAKGKAGVRLVAVDGCACLRWFR